MSPFYVMTLQLFLSLERTRLEAAPFEGVYRWRVSSSSPSSYSSKVQSVSLARFERIPT